MTSPLNRAVVDHFEQQCLDDSQLQALAQLQAIRLPDQQRRTNRAAYALALVFFLALSFLISDSSNNEPQQIAREVANNHLRMKPLDVDSNNLDEVRSFFTLLDFLPISSSHYGQTNPLILGGRYCSIKGVSAAQLRFENTRGKLETLYQVPYDPDVFSVLPQLEQGDSPITLFERGLEITIWVEKGLLMVSATPLE